MLVRGNRDPNVVLALVIQGIIHAKSTANVQIVNNERCTLFIIAI